MPSSFNKVILMGNLTRDVEIRSTPSGMSIGSFGLAINEKFKDKDGNWQERPVFVDCDIFGTRAEAMAKYLGKGSPVFVEGRLKLDQWDDKNDGSKRSKLKVVCENFQFVGGNKGEGDGEQGGGYSRGGGAKAAAKKDDFEIDMDDVPF